MDGIRSGLDAACASTAPDDIRSALKHAAGSAHTLAGSASSMGFAGTGRTASALEVLLDGLLASDNVPSGVAWAQIRLLERSLLDRVATLNPEKSSLLGSYNPRPTPSPLPAPRDGEEPRAVLIGAAWVHVADRLSCYGWAVTQITDVASARDLRAPTLALVDLDCVPDGTGGLADVTSAEGPWPGVPWYAAQTQPSARMRTEAIAAGAAGVLAKPINADTLIDDYTALLAASAETMKRVLILDPDPALAAVLRHSLESADASAEIAAGPGAVFQEALAADQDGGVDAIVIVARDSADDARDKTRNDALDLAMALRQDPGCSTPGLLLVLPSADLDPVAGAPGRIADGVMAWPVNLDLFSTTVLGQAARAQGRRLASQQEGTGPVFVHAALKHHLTRLIDRANALDLPLAVAWMQSSGPADPDPLLARLFHERLRRSDLLGRGADGGLVAVLPFLEPDAVEALLASVAGRLARLSPGTTLSLGIASLDQDRDDAATLLARARANAEQG